MTIWVYRPGHPHANDNGMVDKSLLFETSEQDGKSVHVISDVMDETRHMADGKYYTSKAAFRRATKAAGCIEVGNEVQTMMRPRQRIEMSREERRADIRKAFQMWREGYRPHGE